VAFSGDTELSLDFSLAPQREKWPARRMVPTEGGNSMSRTTFRGNLPALLLIAVTSVILPAGAFSEEALLAGVPYVVQRADLD